ncbi:MAG TPA: bifunctional methionine sulfoxide reductase B/A protein [Candidatus Ozemobacteraceae bacterium]|nr:bifunctional methionine sulfoxide reductase B/A protein [Candidatus Ozemobacteraceae bacterium]
MSSIRWKVPVLAPVIGLTLFWLAATLYHARPSTAERPGVGEAAAVTVRVPLANGGLSERMSMKKVTKSDALWQRLLTPEQYRIARGKGTERAFCGSFYNHKQSGLYVCICCGLPLYHARAKFDSGTGWPSFFEPVAPENVSEHPDHSHGMVRTEILCTRCDAHLGHVFDDGPPPSGRRHCLNSESLAFIPDDLTVDPEKPDRKLELATFGMGCFWGVEALFREVPGVVSAESGYSGGTVPWPSYEEVCEHGTGHAEVVLVRFDPAQVTYEQLLDVFWKNHDPTQLNRQGPDVGDQYRSAVFSHAEAQKKAAEASKQKLEEAKAFARPIVTQITAAAPFYRAEEYHQRYFEKHPEAGCHIIRRK